MRVNSWVINFSPSTQKYLTICGIALIMLVQLSRPDRFIADDSYFYMTIARNLALTGKQTFSGTIPTNGVHPLWLYVLSGYYWLLSLISTKILYSAISIFPLSVLLIGLGSFNAWKISEILALDSLTFTLIPASFICAFNLAGSEAFLHYACLGTLVLLALRPERSLWNAFWVGLAGSAVVLARLDSIFFVLVFLIWLITQKGMKFAIQAGITTALPLLVYILSNIYYFGGAVPVSGWLKSSFPIITVNWFTYDKLASQILNYNILFGIVPILFATFILFYYRRALMGNISIAWVFYAATFLHFLYTSLLTRSATGWFWYYILPIYLCSFALVVLIKYNHCEILQCFIILLIVPIIFLSFAGYSLRTAYRKVEWTEEAKIVLSYLNENQINDATIIAGDLAGETAFNSKNYVVSLDMLTMNRRFVENMSNSPNGLRYIINCASVKDKPIYVFWTSGNWFERIDANQLQTELIFWFRPPPGKEIQNMGTLEIGKPISIGSQLIVWRIPPELITQCPDRY